MNVLCIKDDLTRKNFEDIRPNCSFVGFPSNASAAFIQANRLTSEDGDEVRENYRLVRSQRPRCVGCREIRGSQVSGTVHLVAGTERRWEGSGPVYTLTVKQAEILDKMRPLPATRPPSDFTVKLRSRERIIEEFFNEHADGRLSFKPTVYADVHLQPYLNHPGLTSAEQKRKKGENFPLREEHFVEPETGNIFGQTPLSNERLIRTANVLAAHLQRLRREPSNQLEVNFLISLLRTIRGIFQVSPYPGRKVLPSEKIDDPKNHNYDLVWEPPNRFLPRGENKFGNGFENFDGANEGTSTAPHWSTLVPIVKSVVQTISPTISLERKNWPVLWRNLGAAERAAFIACVENVEAKTAAEIEDISVHKFYRALRKVNAMTDHRCPEGTCKENRCMAGGDVDQEMTHYFNRTSEKMKRLISQGGFFAVVRLDHLRVIPLNVTSREAADEAYERLRERTLRDALRKRGRRPWKATVDPIERAYNDGFVWYVHPNPMP
jgi:hypothetical protein